MQLRTRQTPSLVLLICFCWLTPGSSPVCREKPCHYCGNPGQPDNASCFYRSLLGSPRNKSMRSDVRLRDCGQKERSGYLRIISRTGQLLAVHQATWLAPAIFNLFNDESWIYCSCFSVNHLYYNTGLNFDMNMSMLERIPNTCCINSSQCACNILQDGAVHVRSTKEHFQNCSVSSAHKLTSYVGK